MTATRTLAFKIEQEFYDAVHRAAHESYTSLSDYVREAIRQRMEREKGEK